MSGTWRIRALGSTLALGMVAFMLLAADKTPLPERREQLRKVFQAGNFKDAYEGLRPLALDPKNDGAEVGNDLTLGLACLQNLGRVDEIDDFREAVIAAHKDNWRLLETAAQSLAQGQHAGTIVAGKFYRGQHRGNARFVGTMERDRTRALQLMQQALALTAKDKDHAAVAAFDLHFASLLVNGAGYHDSWRLQYLTDLTQLPDYEDGYNPRQWRGGGDTRGAPVDEQGNPVFHKLPKSYEAAQTDGERWRWMLAEAARLDPNRLNETETAFADFLRGQFGEQTMAQFGWRPRDEDDDKKDASGTYALHTLGDDETIARLATGIKRFKLPDEYNWIVIYRRVAGRGKSPQGEHARDTLASTFEDRRQYVKAVEAWKDAVREYGAGANNHRQSRLDQLVGNWGRIESGGAATAGRKATVDYRFRNGTKVTFAAHAVKVDKLLADVKSYLKSSPGQLDWNKFNIQNIGHRLVDEGQAQYLGDKVASWDLDLKPRPNHVDDRVTVTTPLQKAGAYLLTATMAGGNTSRVIVWVSDSVLVRKQLDGQTLYYVADAASGQPVAKADVEFFGWKQVQIQPNKPQYRVDTVAFKQAADADGQVILGLDKVPNDHQWLVIARQGDRLAYLGFSHIWYGRQYDQEYNQTKVFAITDRPVYRPEQTAQFKFWVRHAKYDQADTSDFAGQSFTVQINNPRGEKVFEKAFTADEYGGLAGEFPLSKGAMLGAYQLFVVNHGGGSFRVEEYKKPEFEVKVEAPTEPVRLGEKIEATVQAKYYFGAPVTSAKVKYKVTRTAHTERWYPRGDWDWLYGKGYWWFAADYAWFPGWNDWGCLRPVPPWWGRGFAPPEVVAENEAAIGADGTLKVPIDTAAAKALHGNEDHEYTITAEVVDESRRTIVGTGKVLVARKPFKVFSWVDRGHYRAGDTVKASFRAQTLDGKPVQGEGELTLFKVSYPDGTPSEKAVETWKLATNEEGQAKQQLKAAEPGQYRLSYRVTDAKKNTIEGGYLFTVRGEGTAAKEFRFNDLELVTDKREYAPGEKVKLLVNVNQSDAAVLLFVRAANGICLPPKVLRLQGKSVEEEIAVIQKDMPNFFIEALTVADSKVHSEVREVVVPPEKRVVNVEVLPSQTEYKPGQKATVQVKLTDMNGKPFAGTTVATVYDRSVEYVSGGSNVPEIREFFWKWRRQHHPQSEASLNHWFGELLKRGEVGMGHLGAFGEGVVEEVRQAGGGMAFGRAGKGMGGPGGPGEGAALRSLSSTRDGAGMAPAAMAPAPMEAKDGKDADNFAGDKQKRAEAGGDGPPQGPEPTVRRNFADTAFWSAALTAGPSGVAEFTLTMPENLTGWKVKAWAMGHGTKVGQGEAEVTTKKDLLVRLQAPRFFVQKDEVVLSANVHNYLKGEKLVNVALELEGGTLVATNSLTTRVTIPPGGEKRVDWRVKVQSEGSAVVRIKAITDTDSDAMEMRFPCHVHGMLKTESYAGVIRPDKDTARVELTVPAERRVNETRLEVRYSPTLAGALVDALPYLVEYPYGCTEQTLNRFLPTVVTQRVLQRMNVNLKDIEKKRTNLNAQEIGDDKERAKGWKRFERNPVFDEEEVKKMTLAGVQALQGMQLSDGGWGWFSGSGEQSWPHTTAVVVHGLQIARENDVALAPGVVERGLEWLKNYQKAELQKLRNFAPKTIPYKEHADNLDAFVYMVLYDAGVDSDEMRAALYRDRTDLSVYAKAMFGLALAKQPLQVEKLQMILKNIEQFLVQDDENQTAYLKLPAGNSWWYWYGDETEANAYYLKLLARTSPKDEKASRLVKYLLNNRKHATYWRSTRDTAVCIEAMADYLKASGEDKPDMTVEVWLDGKKHKEVKVDATNLFTFDNKMVLAGDAVDTGRHVLELRRKGTGPVYFNAYLTNFTLEDPITGTGLEVKVNRKYYKLTRVDKSVKVSGARGQTADQKVEKYERSELANLATLKSGDLVEVELEIDSKNDYEYLLFEDPKAAGFEPVLLRSGYNPNDMGAFMELRDDRVCFFARTLARGKHSVAYRLRAEIPGTFSALPTLGYAMYAPELKGNSDEIKLTIKD